jgi:hypothetical protein
MLLMGFLILGSFFLFVQYKNRFYGPVHYLVYGAAVEYSIHHIVVAFYQAKDVGFIAYNKVHNSINGIAFIDVIKTKLRSIN